MELDCVRKLKQTEKILLGRLENLRGLTVAVTRPFDGMPRAKNLKSRLEEWTIKITELERELELLREAIVKAKLELAEEIISTESDERMRRLKLLRYVHCLSYLQIARRMRCSLRHVYRLFQRGHS